jgi:EAL domain-containing protein (putative c-di-GMP-specific phosphodiesterase class I)
MVAARTEGGHRYAFFEAAMEAEARQRQQWLKELRTAIDQDQFELHYQPKIEAQSGRVSGLEALVRWRHPDKGLVSPSIFIPLAEQFGLINELGRWVIRDACRQLREWSDLGLTLRVAVNLSVHQLRDPLLADDIIAALSRHGIDPQKLICEITESAAMDDAVATSAVFGQLEHAGVALSIDDFGTGYSSLSHLRKLPLHQLKIDRSFVSDVAENDDALSIVRGIIELAHALRLEVVAEGVETRAQQDVLVRLGCDRLQGFLFAKPMHASDVQGWLRERETPAGSPEPALEAA